MRCRDEVLEMRRRRAAGQQGAMGLCTMVEKQTFGMIGVSTNA